MAKASNALDLDDLLEKDLVGTRLKEISDLVARHSWWVSPEVYQEIKVVYPKTRRKRGSGERRNEVKNGVRLWYNEPASQAFWMAVGRSKDSVKNF